jgi:hypothetical protein
MSGTHHPNDPSPSSLTKSENGSLAWDLQIIIGGQRFTL